MHSDSEFCHNCGIRLSGRFCAACGQKALPLNLTFHDFFHDFTHEMLHVDGRIFQSIRRLLLSPGFLTREYLIGHRAQWISPIRLYLISSVIFFTLSAFVPYQVSRQTQKPGFSISWQNGPRVGVTVGDDEDEDAAAKKLGFENIAELSGAVNHALAAWLPRVMFVLLPLFGWLVALAYRRVDRNYLHHLIFAFHVHAAFFAVGALAVAAKLVSRPLGDVLQSAAILYTTVYAILAFRGAYGKVRRAYLRIGFVLAMYFVAVTMALFTIIAPLILPRILAGAAK